MKRLLPFLFSFMILLILPSITKAAELTTYSSPVYVSVFKAPSLTMKLNSDYQLTNNQNGTSSIIPADTTVTIKKSSSTVEISYTGVDQTSTIGFIVQEISNPSATPVATLSNGYSYRGSFSLKINGSYVEVINYLDIEDYVKGVVPNEMPASWSYEAVKAQAIASRSYALASKSTLSSTVASQVYRGYGSENARSNQAVDDTKGLTVKFAGKTIQAFFYSSSGGQTANYGDVWNPAYAVDYPYFVSVSDQYENSPYTNWTVSVPASDILNSFGFSSTAKLYDISLQATGANGEVSGVTVKTSSGDKTITGNESTIRGLFPIGSVSNYNKLYSNWFTLATTTLPSLSNISLSVQTASGNESISDVKGQTVQTASGTVVLDDSNVSVQTASGIVTTGGQTSPEIASVTINGKGFGHRIGMSQYGAKGFAEHGWTAVQILQHYFVGTTVSL